MNCTNCGAENAPGAKFCHNCGAGLPAKCATCGAEQPAGAKFCNNCGMMKTQRSRHLAGSALVRLADGERAEALRLAEEALAYAAEYGMKNLFPLMHLTHGKVLAALGRDEAALDAYYTAEREARAMAMLPLVLQTHVAAARSLSALGCRDKAARAVGEAWQTMGAIADMFVDGTLRAAYVESATRRINRGITV